MFKINPNSDKMLPIEVWFNDEQELYSDTELYKQLLNLANHPFIKFKIILMPDGHTGFGIPIGGIAAFEKALCPNAIGKDIACGMMAIKTNLHKEELSKELLKKIISQIKRDIPMGFRHRSDKEADKHRHKLVPYLQSYVDECKKYNIKPLKEIIETDTANQLGTLGGGNHFIEIQEDENDIVWIMIHSGSRNIGATIADKFHKIAVHLNQLYKTPLPTHELAVIPEGVVQFNEYKLAVDFCINFSYLNRKCMADDIKYAFEKFLNKSIKYLELINIHHNFASLENIYGKNLYVHRKGATRVTKNIKGIIPGSMGTNSYIVRGNEKTEKTFYSCSHGAGRHISRKKAKELYTLDEFKEKMENIVSLDINQAHIDESPMAYKDIDIVIQNQQEIIDIISVLKPIANIKG